MSSEEPSTVLSETAGKTDDPSSPGPPKQDASLTKQETPPADDETSFATAGGVAEGESVASADETKTQTPLSGSQHGLSSAFHGLSSGSKHRLPSGSRHSPIPPSSTVEVGPSTKLVMLVSTLFTYTNKQNRVLAMLRAKGIEPEIVDGTDPINANLRDKYFGISGNWGNYPQFFAVDGTNGNADFVGEYETIASLNDSGNLTRNKLLSTRVPQSPSAMRFRKSPKVTAKQNIMGTFGGLAPLSPEQDIKRQSFAGKIQQLPISPKSRSELSRVQLKKPSDHSHTKPVSPQVNTEAPRIQPLNPPSRPPPPPPPPPPLSSPDDDSVNSNGPGKEKVETDRKSPVSSDNKQSDIPLPPTGQKKSIPSHGVVARPQASVNNSKMGLYSAGTTKDLPTVKEEEKVPLLEDDDFSSGDESWLPPSMAAIAKMRSKAKSRKATAGERYLPPSNLSQKPPIRSARVDFTGAILNNAEGLVHWLPPSMLDENYKPRAQEVKPKAAKDDHNDSFSFVPNESSISRIMNSNKAPTDSRQVQESFDASGFVLTKVDSAKLNDPNESGRLSLSESARMDAALGSSSSSDASSSDVSSSDSSSEKNLDESAGMTGQSEEKFGKGATVVASSSESSSLEADVALEDVVRNSEAPAVVVPRSIAVQKKVTMGGANSQNRVTNRDGGVSWSNQPSTVPQRSRGAKSSSTGNKTTSCLGCKCIIGSCLTVIVLAVAAALFFLFYDRDSSTDPPSNPTGAPPPNMNPSSQTPMGPSDNQPASPPSPSSQNGSISADVLLDLLTQVSTDNGASLRDPSSPQYAAMEWIRTPNNTGIFTDQRFLARYALATLYYSTRGEEWTTATNWLTDSHECDWFSGNYGRINSPSCDVDLNFVHLDLAENNLDGTLPPELVLLGHGKSV